MALALTIELSIALLVGCGQKTETTESTETMPPPAETETMPPDTAMADTMMSHP